MVRISLKPGVEATENKPHNVSQDLKIQNRISIILHDNGDQFT